jgi:hypothetical protein
MAVPPKKKPFGKGPEGQLVLKRETFKQKYARLQKLVGQLPSGFSALQWLYNHVKDSGMGGRKPTITRPLLGSLVAFEYDPKYKETLPYYDIFPMPVVVKLYTDGFLGLNLHYIPPSARKKIIEIMFQAPMSRSKTGDRLTQPLMPFKGSGFPWQFAYKRYLGNHITTQIVNIPEEEWLIATLLPLAEFKKKTASYVWSLAADVRG